MTTSVAIILVPFPAQSHLNQLLRFSLLLSAQAKATKAPISIHYVASAIHIKQAQSRIHSNHQTLLHNIQFDELPLPQVPNPTPEPKTLAGLGGVPTKFPAHMQPIFDAFENVQAPFATLLYSLSEKYSKLVVIHDTLCSFAALEAELYPNAEAYVFHCVSSLFCLHLCRPDTAEELLRSRGLNVSIPPSDGVMTEEFAVYLERRLARNSNSCAGVFSNTCRPLEAEFIDLLAREPQYQNVNLYAIGPLMLTTPFTSNINRQECLNWLDKQPTSSVLYVSFGTVTTLEKEQIEQLAIALQHSGQRFIWVLRDADRCNIFADDDENKRGRPYSILPVNFEKSVEGKGMLITEWAPQLEILAHPSIVAFLSHCGWNSCIESLYYGVPIIAWPMHCDQPLNANIVTQYLKVGVTVIDWARRNEKVLAGEIEEAIKRVTVYDEGKDLIKRAKILGKKIQIAASEGGSSRTDLDAFIARITSI